MQDPYGYPNTHILRNKFNIKDNDELQTAERRLSKYRAAELMNAPIRGQFDFTHLCKIHAYLFQDIYDWAGKVRTVDIAKGNLFCRYFAIDSEASRIFTELKKAATGDNISVISSLLKTNALENYHIKNADLYAIKNIENNASLRTFALLYLTSHDLLKTLDALKCSNSFKNYCSKFIFVLVISIFSSLMDGVLSFYLINKFKI